MTPRLVTVLVAALAAPGCLVIGLDRFYDDAAIAFDERLVGAWRDAEDAVTVIVERSEWRSYRIRYTHPIEAGELTAYLFTEGGHRYLDLTPVRGRDLGSFVVPVHALARVTISADEVVVLPLRFDWFVSGLEAGSLPAGLGAARAEREQVLLTAPRGALAAWLEARPAADPAFGPETRFRRDPARRP